MNFYRFCNDINLIGITFQTEKSEIANLVIIFDNGNINYNDFHTIRYMLPYMIRFSDTEYQNITFITLHPRIYIRNGNLTDIDLLFDKTPRIKIATYNHIDSIQNVLNDTYKNQKTNLIIIDPVRYIGKEKLNVENFHLILYLDNHEYNEEFRSMLEFQTSIFRYIPFNALQFYNLNNNQTVKFRDYDFHADIKKSLIDKYGNECHIDAKLILNKDDTMNDLIFIEGSILDFIEYEIYHSIESISEDLTSALDTYYPDSSNLNDRVRITNLKYIAYCKSTDYRKYHTGNHNIDQITSQILVKNNSIPKKASLMKNIMRLTTSDHISQMKDLLNRDPPCMDNKEMILSDSLDCYMSALTLGEWPEQIMDKSCIGILADVSNKNRLSYIYANADHIIHTVSTDCLSVDEFLTEYCQNIQDIANLSIYPNLFTGHVNAIFPLYIDEQHWEYSKIYYPYLLSLIFMDSPIFFSPVMWNIVYHVLIKYVIDLYSNNNCRYINIMIGFLRTCNAISLDLGYDKRIRNLLKKIDNMKKYDYILLFGEILSLGTNIDETKFMNIFQGIIRMILSRYVNKYNNLLNDISSDNETDKLKSIRDHISYDTSIVIDELNAIYNFYDILHKIKAMTGGMKRFIDLIDENDGIIPENISSNIMDWIKEHALNSDDFKRRFSMTDDDQIKILLKIVNTESNLIIVP